MWATDNNKVQGFMFGYLKDPLREVEQPYFHQDEVHTHTFATAPTFSFSPFFLFLFVLISGYSLTNGKNANVFFTSCVFRCPPCVLGVGGRCSEIDMDSHDLGLKHLLPHRQKKVIDCGVM